MSFEVTFLTIPLSSLSSFVIHSSFNVSVRILFACHFLGFRLHSKHIFSTSAMKIHMSGKTCELLQTFGTFDIATRGEVIIKVIFSLPSLTSWVLLGWDPAGSDCPLLLVAQTKLYPSHDVDWGKKHWKMFCAYFYSWFFVRFLLFFFNILK